MAGGEPGFVKREAISEIRESRVEPEINGDKRREKPNH